MDITPYLPRIIPEITRNVTFLLVAPTGSGKSVGVPQALGLMKTKKGRAVTVRVTVPTRASAIGLWSEQKRLLKNDKMVGYAAESEVRYDYQTPIAYVTTGHMRRKMLNLFKRYFDPHLTLQQSQNVLNFCNVLMVDEIHIGSVDNDIVVGLWMKAYSLGMTVPRLLLASATPIEMNIDPPPYRYDVDLPRRYRIEEIAHGPSPAPDAKGHLFIEAAKVALRYLDQFDRDGDAGHILIFVPGKKEISTLESFFQAKTNPQRVNVLGISGQSDEKTINEVLSPSTDRRKIVIATNVAETSITIKDLGLVIDTLLEKSAETSSNGGLKLITAYISKDSARQRRGRTGRTRDGIYYYMATESQFSQLKDHRDPEITRVPVHKYVLELMEVGLKPEEILRGALPGSIKQSQQLLIRLGMIDEQGVTEKGKKSVNYPLSIQNCSFLYDWLAGGEDSYTGIAMAAIIEAYSGGFYYVPNDRDLKEMGMRKNQYLEKYFGRFTGESSLQTAFNVWNAFLIEKRDYESKNSKMVLREWSKANSMNNKKLGEVLNLINDISNQVIREGKLLVVSPISYQDNLEKMSRYLSRSYSAYRLKGKQYLDNKGKTYSLLGQAKYNEIIALSTMEMGRDNHLVRSIDLFVPAIRVKRRKGSSSRLEGFSRHLLPYLDFNFVDLTVEYYRYRYGRTHAVEWETIYQSPHLWGQTNNGSKDHVFSRKDQSKIISPYLCADPSFFTFTSTPEEEKIITDYLTALNKVKNLDYPMILKQGKQLYLDEEVIEIPLYLQDYPPGYVMAAYLRHSTLNPDYLYHHTLSRQILYRQEWKAYPQVRLLGANPFQSNKFPFYSHHMDVDAIFGGCGKMRPAAEHDLVAYRLFTEEELAIVLDCPRFRVWSFLEQPGLQAFERPSQQFSSDKEIVDFYCYSNF